jgi:DNA-3-methyladenine glycosylase II
LKTFSKSTYKKYCNQLRNDHISIAKIHNEHGFPPFWKRENSFESMCKTIIEQQVSLASAKSSFERLKNKYRLIEPSNLARLSVDDFRECGITKQKANYIKLLSERLLLEPDFFDSLEKLDSESTKEKLISLKGIGHWTANVYLLVALNRRNIYPDFDVALINSIAYEEFGGKKMSNDEAKNWIENFNPLKSIACCYYYHAYIQRKKIVFTP